MIHIISLQTIIQNQRLIFQNPTTIKSLSMLSSFKFLSYVSLAFLKLSFGFFPRYPTTPRSLYHIPVSRDNILLLIKIIMNNAIIMYKKKNYSCNAKLSPTYIIFTCEIVHVIRILQRRCFVTNLHTM